MRPSMMNETYGTVSQLLHEVWAGIPGWSSTRSNTFGDHREPSGSTSYGTAPHSPNTLDGVYSNGREHSHSNKPKRAQTSLSFDIPSVQSVPSSAQSRGRASDCKSSAGKSFRSNTARRGTFSDIDRKAAIGMVRRGDFMHCVAIGGGPLGTVTGCCNPCYKCRYRCRRLTTAKKFCYFVVMENSFGHYELRWDSNSEQARSEKAQFRVLLSEMSDVSPVVLQEDGDAELESARKFRILFGSRALKLWAQDRQSMKEWVVALISLQRIARGSNMRAKNAPDTALRGYIKHTFAKVDKSKSAQIGPEELADWLRKLNKSASEEYVDDIMAEFDKDGSEALDFDEFTELFHMLTVKDALVPWFEKYAIPFQYPDENATPQAVDEANAGDLSHDAIMNTSRGLGVDRFQLFLELEQGEKQFFGPQVTLDGVDGLFATLPEPYTQVVEGKTLLTQAGFSRLMCCAENDLFDPARRAQIGQDMTQPLSHYWIATSHNTYLEGHQLVGESSLEQYMDVLLRGCRCVEIDCWDGDDGEPIVTHGWTPTSKLYFRDVIKVCRDYAFVASQYPLILSLEVHCGFQQRCRMASLLVEILGDRLLHGMSTKEILVSPEEARNRILVKAKLKHIDETKRNNESTFSQHTSARTIGSQWWMCWCRYLFVCCCFFRCCSKRRSPNTDPENDDDEDVIRSSDYQAKQSKCNSDEPDRSPSRTLLTLSDITYLAGKRLPKNEAFTLSGSDLQYTDYPCSCISINDTKARKLLDSNRPVVLQSYTRQQLLRVYPHAKRVGSGNFDPFSMWLAGVQLVALNYQSLDLPVICNEGLFLHENGGAGFVLKPALVRGYSDQKLENKSSGRTVATTRTIGNPPKRRDKSPVGSHVEEGHGHVATEEPVEAKRTEKRFLGSATDQDIEDAKGVGLGCNLELTVLSAHSLPKPGGEEDGGLVSPVVVIHVLGLQEDRRRAETWRIVDNGFNPRWNQLFSFEVSEPSIAMLILEVINVTVAMRRVRRDFLAASALPFSGIREGIRWVPLFDWKHQCVELCGLLVEVRLRGPWAELRRRQRLARSPVPPNMAHSVSYGPGGLNHDHSGVPTAARQHQRYRMFARASTNFSGGLESQGQAEPQGGRTNRSGFTSGSDSFCGKTGECKTGEVHAVASPVSELASSRTDPWSAPHEPKVELPKCVSNLSDVCGATKFRQPTTPVHMSSRSLSNVVLTPRSPGTPTRDRLSSSVSWLSS